MTASPTEQGLRRATRRNDHRVLKSEAPPVVLDEMKRAFTARRSLTAQIFGDPLPGCSALDKRGISK